MCRCQAHVWSQPAGQASSVSALVKQNLHCTVQFTSAIIPCREAKSVSASTMSHSAAIGSTHLPAPFIGATICPAIPPIAFWQTTLPPSAVAITIGEALALLDSTRGARCRLRSAPQGQRYPALLERSLRGHQTARHTCGVSYERVEDATCNMVAEKMEHAWVMVKPCAHQCSCASNRMYVRSARPSHRPTHKGVRFKLQSCTDPHEQLMDLRSVP